MWTFLKQTTNEYVNNSLINLNNMITDLLGHDLIRNK